MTSHAAMIQQQPQAHQECYMSSSTPANPYALHESNHVLDGGRVYLNELSSCSYVSSVTAPSLLTSDSFTLSSISFETQNNQDGVSFISEGPDAFEETVMESKTPINLERFSVQSSFPEADPARSESHTNSHFDEGRCSSKYVIVDQQNSQRYWVGDTKYKLEIDKHFAKTACTSTTHESSTGSTDLLSYDKKQVRSRPSALYIETEEVEQQHSEDQYDYSPSTLSTRDHAVKDADESAKCYDRHSMPQTRSFSSSSDLFGDWYNEVICNMCAVGQLDTPTSSICGKDLTFINKNKIFECKKIQKDIYDLLSSCLDPFSNEKNWWHSQVDSSFVMANPRQRNSTKSLSDRISNRMLLLRATKIRTQAQRIQKLRNVIRGKDHCLSQEETFEKIPRAYSDEGPCANRRKQRNNEDKHSFSVFYDSNGQNDKSVNDYSINNLCYESDPGEALLETKFSESTCFSLNSVCDEMYAPEEHTNSSFEVFDVDSVSQRVKEFMNETLTLTWHQDQEKNQKSIPPVCVHFWVERGTFLKTDVVQPKIMWQAAYQHTTSKRQKLNINTNVVGIRLVSICRVLECKEINRDIHPFVKMSHSFFIENCFGERYLFEACSEKERDETVSKVKLIVSRLASLAVVGDADGMMDFFNPPINVGETANTWTYE